MALTFKLKVLGTLENGRMTSSITREKRSGLTVHSLRESTLMVRRMVRGNSIGPTALPLKATLSIMSYKVKEFTSGLTTECLMESGWTIKCMEPEYLLGLTAESTSVNTKTIKKMDMEFLPGPIRGSTTATGWVVSKTV